MTKKAWVAVAIIVALMALTTIVLLIGGGLWLRAQGGFGPHMMMGSWGHPRSIGPLAGGLMLLALLLFGIIGGAVALLIVGAVGRKPKAPEGEPTALEILKRRYASGEIDREEFERMKEELSA